MIALLRSRHTVPVAAGAAFLALALFVLSGRSFGFDTTLVMLMRHAGDPATPLGPPWFREAMRDLTALGSMVALAAMTLVAAAALWKTGFARLALALFASILGATAMSVVLKLAIGRDRPDIVEHAALTFTASFPSGHAFLATVTLLCIAGFTGLASRRADIARLCLIMAWILILMIGCSRIYLGVHWPSDVLAGWLLGAAWSSLAIGVAGRSMLRQDRTRA